MKNPLSKLFKKPKHPLCYAFEFKQEAEHHPFDLLVKKYPSLKNIENYFVKENYRPQRGKHKLSVKVGDEDLE